MHNAAGLMPFGTISLVSVMSEVATIDSTAVSARAKFSNTPESRFWKRTYGGEFAHRCYEGAGLEWWQKVVTSSEYYQLPDEVQLIEDNAKEIASLVRDGLEHDETVTLVELGSGSLAALEGKTDKVTRALEPDNAIIVDDSKDVLDTAESFFTQCFQEVAFDRRQRNFNTDQLDLPKSGRRLMVQFGSTISNMPGARDDPLPYDKLVSCLSNYADALQPGDILVIGYDSNQNSETALASYSGEAHRQFSENLIDVLAADERTVGLERRNFRYKPHWQDHSKAVTHDFVAQKNAGHYEDGEWISYLKGDAHNYSNSYKYPVSIFKKAANDTQRLQPIKSWMGPENRMGLHAFRVC